MRAFLALFIAVWTGSTIAADLTRPSTPPSHMQTAAEAEQDLWDNIKGGKNPTVFEAYLKEYPQGRFAPAARVMIAKLKSPSIESGRSLTSNQTPPSLAAADTISKNASKKESHFYIADSNGCKVFHPNSASNETITWSGSCRDGYADGTGRLEWFKNQIPHGVYVGELKSGKRDGRGTYYYPDGARFEGEFKDQEITGQGTFYYADGSRYAGAWRNGKRNGQGTLYLPGGTRYEGEFLDGQFNGQGTLYYAGGDRYVGAWRNGKRNGTGTYFNANGDRYEGEFLNDARNGQGTYYYHNGDVCKPPEWQNGSPCVSSCP